ncbi:MAG: putative signal transducing protein [Muribaculaceae bacterium]
MEHPEDLVKLQEYEFIADAYIIKGMLESNGIPATVTDEYNPYGSAFSKPRVLVFRRDEAAARELMQSAELSDGELDAMAEASGEQE